MVVTRLWAKQQWRVKDRKHKLWWFWREICKRDRKKRWWHAGCWMTAGLKVIRWEKIESFKAWRSQKEGWKCSKEMISWWHKAPWIRKEESYIMGKHLAHFNREKGKGAAVDAGNPAGIEDNFSVLFFFLCMWDTGHLLRAKMVEAHRNEHYLAHENAHVRYLY